MIGQHKAATKTKANFRLIQAFNPGGGVLPYIRYIGMLHHKGYGFRAVLV